VRSGHSNNEREKRKRGVTPTLLTITKERGHTYTPDNGGADRLVAEEMKQSKSVKMLERELGL
jgi:hypothetical protein